MFTTFHTCGRLEFNGFAPQRLCQFLVHQMCYALHVHAHACMHIFGMCECTLTWHWLCDQIYFIVKLFFDGSMWHPLYTYLPLPWAHLGAFSCVFLEVHCRRASLCKSDLLSWDHCHIWLVFGLVWAILWLHVCGCSWMLSCAPATCSSSNRQHMMPTRHKALATERCLQKGAWNLKSRKLMVWGGRG